MIDINSEHEKYVTAYFGSYTVGNAINLGFHVSIFAQYDSYLAIDVSCSLLYD
jgi:hypothetical protein